MTDGRPPIAPSSQADRTTVDGASLPDRTPIAARSRGGSNSAATNSPMSRWSGRTVTGRRCRDLFRSFMRQAGLPTEAAAHAQIMSAAEQTVIAELARADCLAPGGLNKINLEMAIRAENLANRTLKRLKLDKVTPSTKTKSSARERAEAAQRAIEAAAAENAEGQP